MEIVENEAYVSFDTANALKELGFNLPVRRCYCLGTLSVIDTEPRDSNSGLDMFGHDNGDQYRSAPTLSVVQRWLRENYNMHIMIDCIGRQNWLPTIQYMTSDKDIIVQDNAKPKMCSKYYGYDTYEESLEAGITKCIGLLIEEKEKRESCNAA